MDPTTILIPAAIPPSVLGTLVPAALFGVWSGLVVVVLAGLCAVIGMDDQRVAHSEDAAAFTRSEPATA
ncbi:MAG TPA: hypothetical protein VKA21_04335 [Candidatus Binatia bacterium]|nr:hypothetical protein [Candidatus Binatia bacterium]